MKDRFTIFIIISVIFLVFLMGVMDSKDNGGSIFGRIFRDKNFTILMNPDNKDVEEDLMAYAKEKGINLEIRYADDLEAIDLLEDNSKDYDAIWLSNSVWVYMINGVKISDSKAININPALFGIKKSKALSLGFVERDIENKEIIEAIKSGKLKYVMTSVIKTNTGLISYLGFLNALSGSPEILTSEMFNKDEIKEELKTLFSGVERVSGSTSFLEDMFLNSNNYEAVVATESSLIRINKELEKQGKEPLYLLYPTDGVAVNDSPFAYVDNGQERRETFLDFQSFLLSKEEQKKLEQMGKRTWYGGVKSDADSSSFKKEWGINTSKYLNATKYPSREVIDEAIILYIETLRKPASVAFCLDYSGSMYGNGEEELENAMSYILDYDKASKDYLQFTSKDKIYVLPFSSRVLNTWIADNGKETANMINNIVSLEPNGGTNIYGCAIDALRLLEEDSNDYSKTVILMTDGESNYGSIYELENVYKLYNDIPIYSIMFGSADETQLEGIARLTNAKVFDGRTNLMAAFKEVRSYN